MKFVPAKELDGTLMGAAKPGSLLPPDPAHKFKVMITTEEAKVC